MRAKQGAASTPHRPDFTSSTPTLSDANKEKGMGVTFELLPLIGSQGEVRVGWGSRRGGGGWGGGKRCTDSEGLVGGSNDDCIEVPENFPVCG